MDIFSPDGVEIKKDEHGETLETVMPVLVGLAVLGYVSREKAFWHRSRFSEQVYLCCCYVLALSAFVFQHFRHHAKFIGARQVVLNCIACPIILTELFWETIDVGTKDDFHPRHNAVPPEAIEAYRFIAVRLDAICADGGVFFRYDSEETEPMSMAGRMAVPVGSQILVAMMAGVQTGYVRTLVDIVVVILSLIIVLARLRKSIHHIFRDPRLRAEIEAQIEEIRAYPETFDGMVSRLGCAKLIEQLGHGWVTSLVDAGLHTDLSLATRASIISALSRTGPVAPERQRLIVDLLCSTSGWELTELKNLIELGARWKNLHAIVRNSLSDELREELIQKWAQLSPQGDAGLKVFCDIDDTLTSSGGKFPAGSDGSWAKHSMYPGAVAFLKALCVYRPGRIEWGRSKPTIVEPEEQHNGPAAGSPGRASPRQPVVERKNLSTHGYRAHVGVLPEDECSLIFLSARPHMYKGIAERMTFSLFDRLVIEEKLHTSPQLLPGKMASGLFAFLFTPIIGTRAWGPVGHEKFESVKLYMKLFPEYNFVFIGDNGQGDVLAAELMVANLGKRFISAYIHRVVPDKTTLSMYSEKTAESWAKRRLFFFDTYAQAAVLAFEQGHIDKDGLLCVVKSAEDAKEKFFDELKKEQHCRHAWYAARRRSMSEVIRLDSCRTPKSSPEGGYLLMRDMEDPPVQPQQTQADKDIPGHLHMLRHDLLTARRVLSGVSDSTIESITSCFSGSGSLGLFGSSKSGTGTHRTYHSAFECCVQ
mmetsp:Transcript_44124/g.104417  ORF Transcript_44124/g.104417 Transcript_44124/m.104417 type:complete len:761 (-) Transcript_44124:112-2394(-)